MARPEQVLLLEPQHELKFRGKRGGPGFDREGGASASGVRKREAGGSVTVTNPGNCSSHILKILTSRERTAGQLAAS